MKKIFKKNGLVVLDFDHEFYPKDACKGALEVYYTPECRKFYRFIHYTLTNQDTFWVWITDAKIEPFYGCEIEYYRNNEYDDTPVCMVCLLNEALFKRGDQYWIFNEGHFIPVYKEWLQYCDLIPGDLEPVYSVNPPRISDDVKEKLLLIIYGGVMS
jgi:hypothetical protein